MSYRIKGFWQKLFKEHGPCLQCHHDSTEPYCKDDNCASDAGLDIETKTIRQNTICEMCGHPDGHWTSHGPCSYLGPPKLKPPKWRDKKGGTKLIVEFTREEIEAAFAAYATEKLGFEVDFSSGTFYNEDGDECFIESYKLEVE